VIISAKFIKCDCDKVLRWPDIGTKQKPTRCGCGRLWWMDEEVKALTVEHDGYRITHEMEQG
tara:strand:+ start:61 stop:246 length:186 start_codon:yes stop_codon:yes gene_type:complete